MQLFNGVATMILAVHIPDGVLPPSWSAAGYVAAAALLLANGRRLADDEIPRLALLSAAFFVASLIHVRIGPTSVHLLLNGLVGVVLGRRAVIAITVGLALQAVLIGHGGFGSLGVNVCVMTLPAYAAAVLFAALRRLPGVHRPLGRGLLVAAAVALWGSALVIWAEVTWTTAGWPVRGVVFAGLAVIGGLAAVWERRSDNNPDFPIGLLAGEFAVLATIALNALVLRFALPDESAAVAAVVFVAHLPIAALEGVVTGFAVSFLLRVAPAAAAGLSVGQGEQVVERDLPLAQPDADHR
jgi:cobalt/nickel transport system permease protein